jgi:hypothetical protein
MHVISVKPSQSPVKTRIAPASEPARSAIKPDFTACPHVDRNDHRCASRFSISRLDQAFGICLGAFGECPMYHAINREMARGESAVSAPLPFINVTIHADRSRQPLRATGT